MKKIILTFLFSSLVAFNIFAQTDEIMDRAVKEYLRGDYLGAIEDFKRVIEMEENEKAQKLLYKSLVEEGKRRFEKSEFKQAREYFIQAEQIDGLDEETKEMLETSQAELGIKPEKEKKQEAADELQKRIQREKAVKNQYISRYNSLLSQRNTLKAELEKSREELKEAQMKIKALGEKSEKTAKYITVAGVSAGIVAFAVAIVLILTLRKVYFSSYQSRYQLEELEEKIAERLKESDEETEELEERVARSINKMIDGQKDIVKQVSMSAAGKTQADIEEIKDRLEKQFEEQQNKLLEMLQMQARALASEETEKVELKGSGGRRVITDVNPHVRARADGVEMIPKTISDPSVAEKMLKPYLSDPNNRVRGNACVAIHQYNPELAVSALEKMAASSDKWMRLSAAWAVGEIATPEVVPILRKLLDDVDERVKERAMKAFENMAEMKQETGDEIKRMIDKYKKDMEEGESEKA